MIISVASGKGGTGKTTLASNLAVSLDTDLSLLDCDVEAPNLHLFIHPIVETEEQVIAPVPEINLEKCTFCKKCMDICRFNAIAVLKKTAMIFENLCHSCGGCVQVCPENALLEKPRSIGWIQKGSCGSISTIQGKLDIGQVMVPPIINKIRAFSQPDRLTIIDAPPGTSCPVIAAVKNTDFVILVTEPTPFGLNDLKLAVKTVKTLDIPHGIVINRADSGNDDVKDFARQHNVPILMEIPFDKKIAQNYSIGRMMVDTLPGSREKFQALFKNIFNRINKNGLNQ